MHAALPCRRHQCILRLHWTLRFLPHTRGLASPRSLCDSSSPSPPPTSRQGQIGAGLVNLDLKLGHVYLMPGEPLRAQLIDFDYESTYHLADAHVSAACRALVMLALLAAEARKATDRAARGVLKASALHARAAGARRQGRGLRRQGRERHAPHLLQGALPRAPDERGLRPRTAPRQPPGGAQLREEPCGAGRAAGAAVLAECDRVRVLAAPRARRELVWLPAANALPQDSCRCSR